MLSFSILLAPFLLPQVAGFSTHHVSSPAHSGVELQMKSEGEFGRRFILTISGAALVGSLFVPTDVQAEEAASSSKTKVVVMGGAGHVGSRVSVALHDQGFDVTSVSRSATSDQAAKIKANTGKSPAIQFASLDATTDDMSQVMKGASVVVSCVGIPPWEKLTARAGNGFANVRIADAAKVAGVGKFVHVSVASEFSNGPGKFLFGEFFKGESNADATVVKTLETRQSLSSLVLLMGRHPESFVLQAHQGWQQFRRMLLQRQRWLVCWVN